MRFTKIKTSRLTSLIIASFFFIVALLAPAQHVFAFSGAGSGTSLSPYLVTNCTQLQEIKDNLSAHYKLANNIDCSDTVNWNGGKGFDPIGDNTTPFTGSLDGAGHTINDLSIIRANDTPNDSTPEDEYYVGIFGFTQNATVQNIHVRSGMIKGFQMVGGIIGQMDGGSLTASSVNITTTDNSCNPGHCIWARYGAYGGGLVGYLSGGGTVSYSRTAGPVKGSGFEIGGLVGYIEGGTLQDSSTSSNTDGGVDIGGAIGLLNGGTVTRVSASGNAQSNIDEPSGKSGRDAGGFVGTMYSGTITDSYATGTVTADYGPAGAFGGLILGGTISNSYSSGKVIVNVTDNGYTYSGSGFIGALYGASVTNSFTTASIDVLNSDSGAFTSYANSESLLIDNVYYDEHVTGRSHCYVQDTAGTDNGQFSWPIDLGLDTSGNVYVVDASNKRIQKFDSSGNYITKWGTSGSGNGQFNAPRGLAIDSSNNIYVSDITNNTIQKFDSSGNYITKWGTSGSGNGQFNTPWGVAVDSSGNVYIADTGNNRIQKFDSSGNYITKWGTSGSGNGQFAAPYAITIDTSNNVLVLDNFNYRVQKFNTSGVYQSQFGSQGSSDGQFQDLHDITTDPSGNIYVSDAYPKYVVQKFDSSGNFVTMWGGQGLADGKFGYPNGLVADSSNIYVTDGNYNNVNKFNLSGTFVTKWGKTYIGNTGCTAVNTANSDPTYFFNPAHEPFAGSWDPNVWEFSGSSLPVLHQIDNDNDDIADNLEDLAPNGGDGNNDGALDATQSNIASFVNSATGEYATVEVQEGATVVAGSQIVNTSDSGYSYPLGLLGFTITGISTGATVPVTIYWHDNGTAASTFTARKFNNQYSTISGYSLTNVAFGGDQALKLTYSVVDGGALDTDGSANGSITDPVGLASRSSGTLASTGINQYRLVGMASSLVLAGGYILINTLRRRRV